MIGIKDAVNANFKISPIIKGARPQATIGWSQPYNWPSHKSPGIYIKIFAKIRAVANLKIFLSQFNLAKYPNAITAKQ